jgi:hypothetical protein
MIVVAKRNVESSLYQPSTGPMAKMNSVLVKITVAPLVPDGDSGPPGWYQNLASAGGRNSAICDEADSIVCDDGSFPAAHPSVPIHFVQAYECHILRLNGRRKLFHVQISSLLDTFI